MSCTSTLVASYLFKYRSSPLVVIDISNFLFTTSASVPWQVLYQCRWSTDSSWPSSLTVSCGVLSVLVSFCDLAQVASRGAFGMSPIGSSRSTFMMKSTVPHLGLALLSADGPIDAFSTEVRLRPVTLVANLSGAPPAVFRPCFFEIYPTNWAVPNSSRRLSRSARTVSCLHFLSNAVHSGNASFPRVRR